MKKDCGKYDNKECLKTSSLIEKNLKKNEMNFMLVGCWGVFCRDGPFPKENPEKIYGQGMVSKAMANYSEKKDFEALFLAGDNIYIEEEDKKIDGKKINSEEIMKKQIKKGVEECMKDILVPNIYIGIGNHDIEDCEILNVQLNTYLENGRWNLPSLAYNVVYYSTNSNYKINFILIDVNIYSDTKPLCNINKKKYKKNKISESEDKESVDLNTNLIKYRKAQDNWIIEKINEENADWNVLIGHSPIIANGHSIYKNKTSITDNIFQKSIWDITKKIGKNKIHAYFCADVHNMQFLEEERTKIPCIISGTGGTSLDTTFITEKYGKNTWFLSSSFGFVTLKVTKEALLFEYFTLYKDIQEDVKETDGTPDPAFVVKIDRNGQPEPIYKDEKSKK